MVVGGGKGGGEGGRVVTFMDGSYQLDGLRITVSYYRLIIRLDELRGLDLFSVA